MLDIKVHDNEETVRIQFSGSATVDSAVQSLETLAGTITGSKIVELDISRIDKIDTSFFQVLISAERRALEQGCTVRIDPRLQSHIFAKAASLAGFSRAVSGKEPQAASIISSCCSPLFQENADE